MPRGLRISKIVLPHLPEPRLSMPRLPAPRLAPGGVSIDYAALVEEIKPRLPRLPLDEFYAWLKEKERVVFLFGPPGTGKTWHATRLVAHGRVRLSNGVDVVLYDGEGVVPTAGYFTVSMAQDAERRWRGELGGVCDGQVTTIHSFAVRSIGLGLRIFPVVYRDAEGRYHIRRVPDSKAVADPDIAQNIYRAVASRSAGLTYSLDPYRQEAGNYIFQLFDYAVHVGGIPALREAYNRLSERASQAWFKYLRLLRWPENLIYTVLTGKANSLCEAAGGAYELYRMLASGAIKLDFALSIEAARCLRQLYTIKCGKSHVKPRALLLDEFQDLSPALMSLVARIFDDVDYVVLAGDDDQLIYDSLHGASADAALEIVKMIESGEINGEFHVLAKSFRVPETVAERARRVVELIPRRVRKTWRGRDAPGSVEITDCEKLEERVEEELAAGKKVFVLTAENAEAVDVMHRLLARGLIVAGLKGLPGSIRQVYRELVEHVDASKPLDVLLKSHEELPPARVAEFLAAVKGREAEVAKVLKSILNEERAVERLEKLNLFVDTVHAAKGLEADVVFVVNAARNTRVSEEQRRRLTYVAVTRAREKVIVVEGCEGQRWLVGI